MSCSKLKFFNLSVLHVLLLLIVCGSVYALEEELLEVKVTVEGATTISKTDDHFVCATIDWWPQEKCNYGWCPWANSSILHLDLKNPILKNAVKAFNGLRIRAGGSMQDQIYYRVGNNPLKCRRVFKKPDGLFGFSAGCLNMRRWQKLNQFFKDSGTIVTFGLNALNGRNRTETTDENNNKIWLYEGDWDPTNARDLIMHSVQEGFPIESWEFGNELSGGVSAVVKADQYGKDLITLRRVLDEVYKNSTVKPKLLAPGAFYSAEWFKQMLQNSGPGAIDAVTHHIYNLGAGVDPNLYNKIQDPYVLDSTAQTYHDVVETIRTYGSWSDIWISESGGAYNSGGKGISDTYIDGFWYLDQLGQTSTYKHKVFCRQALIGGNYALLNTTTFVPNPDYYGALLWHRQMGPGVLRTSHNGSPYLRAYTHCSRKETGDNGAVTMLLINLSNSTGFNVTVENDLQMHRSAATESNRSREEYHLTPKGGKLQSQVMLLNGVTLQLKNNTEIPEMAPKTVDASTPLRIAPSSIAFVKFKGFKAPACL